MKVKGNYIDDYIVIFPHSQTGYAETYRVRDANGNLRFLKLFKTSDTKEIDIVKQLNHDNLCQVTDYTSNYYVTDFVSGETLDKRLLRGPNLTVYEAKTIVKSVLKALKYLHTRQVPIIHNAVWQKNVFLNLSEELSDLKLLGFSNAKFEGDNVKIDDFDHFPPFYLPPERFNGTCCVQSDLYSVGVLLYYLIFGTLPWNFDFSHSDINEIASRLMNERRQRVKIPLIDKFELDENLFNVIYKALQNDISQRFQSAQEFIDALNDKITVKVSNTANNPMPNNAEVKFSGGFSEVAGMKDLKDLLRKSVINILKNTEKAKKYRLTIPNGMLLYGPPGCGKTFFAEKFAEETGYNYIYVKSSDLASVYIHGTQEKIAALFEEARRNAPTILCFDEFDSFVPSREGMKNSLQSGEVNEFLSQLNNCGQDGVFVIASSNKPDLIDSAVLRRGRIDRIIYIPVPDHEARMAMFELYLKDRPADKNINFKHLADLTQNYVSSDIAFIVNEAAMHAAENDANISQKMIEDVISQTSPSVKSSVLAYYEKLKQKLDEISSASPKNRIGF